MHEVQKFIHQADRVSVSKTPLSAKGNRKNGKKNKSKYTSGVLLLENHVFFEGTSSSFQRELQQGIVKYAVPPPDDSSGSSGIIVAEKAEQPAGVLFLLDPADDPKRYEVSYGGVRLGPPDNYAAFNELAGLSILNTQLFSVRFASNVPQSLWWSQPIWTLSKAILQTVRREYPTDFAIIESRARETASDLLMKRLYCRTPHINAVLFEDNVAQVFRRKFLEKIKFEFAKESTNIFQQGDVEISGGFLVDGSASIDCNSVRLGEVKKDEWYGVLELLGVCEDRPSSLVATTDCVFATLTMSHFLKLNTRFKVDFQPLQRVAVKHLQLLANQAETLYHLPVFQECGANFLKMLESSLEQKMYLAGDKIVVQGEHGDSMYIIARGKVNVVKGGMQLAMMCAGACFGELSVLGISEERAADVVCATPCDVRMLSRDSFLTAVQQYPTDGIELQNRITFAHGVDSDVANEKVLKLPLFEPFSREFLDKVANGLEERHAFPGQTFIYKGAKSDAMFIVVRGTVMIERSSKFDTLELAAPIIVGEVGFLTRRPYGATVRGTGLCDLRVLQRDVFLSFLEDFPNDKTVFDHVVEEESRKHKGQAHATLGDESTTMQSTTLQSRSISRIPMSGIPMGSPNSHRSWHIDFFSQSSTEFLDFLASHLAKCIFYNGQVIFHEGDFGDYGVLLQVGTAVAEIKGRQVAKLEENSFFGEMCMLGIVDKRSATVRATSICISHSLHKTVLLRALEDFPEERVRFCNMIHARGAVIRMLCRGDYDQREIGEKAIMEKMSHIPAIKHEADKVGETGAGYGNRACLSMEILGGKGNFYHPRPALCIIEGEIDQNAVEGEEPGHAEEQQNQPHCKKTKRKLHIEQIQEWITRRKEAVDNVQQTRDMRLIRRGHMCMILPESCGYLNSEIEPHSLVADLQPREIGDTGKSIATFRKAHLPKLFTKDQTSVISESRIRTTKRIYGRRVWDTTLFEHQPRAAWDG